MADKSVNGWKTPVISALSILVLLIAGWLYAVQDRRISTLESRKDDQIEAIAELKSDVRALRVAIEEQKRVLLDAIRSERNRR